MLTTCMYDTLEINSFDMYSVGDKGMAIPFKKWMDLVGVNGELVVLEATFDDGAMVNVIDKEVFEAVRHRILEPQPSLRVLHMANSALMSSGGSWSGAVVVNNVQTEGTLEIIVSGGTWNILFRKPMLQVFAATHKYVTDTITINLNTSNESVPTAIITNENVQNLLPAELLQKSKVAVA